MDSIAILDFGSQTTQLIARRLREAHVFCELFPHDAPPETVLETDPRGFIFSGGPASVYEPDAPQIPQYAIQSGLPLLGICYGMQAMAHSLGGEVTQAGDREFGPARLRVETGGGLLTDGEQQVWMSHGDRIETLPQGFQPLGSSGNSPYAAMGDLETRRFGLQFHPEVRHTPGGAEILRRFAVEICGMRPEWDPAHIVPATVMRIQNQVRSERAMAAVSGGVDSSVAATLARRALGDRMTAVFVDTGLLRRNEAALVEKAMGPIFGGQLIVVDARDRFLSALDGVDDPERKRQIIGELFIRLFEAEAEVLGSPRYLIQGTTYPDVIESRAPERQEARRIKTHHNVGGLPGEMQFELVEPLRFVFKDEVIAIGEQLGLPDELLHRQPFPGPGLAVRCLGSITPDRLERLRAADHIFTHELSQAGMLRNGTNQAFAVLLPVRSVGVMGDQRTYAETIVLRAVTTDDFMTADWARLPDELLGRVANRIVNEVPGVNRVAYDITSKPPATIEWE